MPGVMIRAPRAGDGEGLARCWLDAGAYYASLNPDLFQVPEAEGLAQWLEDSVLNVTPEDRLVLVAELDGHAVGWIDAIVQPPIESAAKQFVRDVSLTRVLVNVLVVQQAYWRQGIGTRLMDAVEEWARRRGAVIALLDTYVDSPVSVPFYEVRLRYRRRALRFHKSLG